MSERREKGEAFIGENALNLIHQPATGAYFFITNVQVINTANAANVKRVVIVNALMPQWCPAAYMRGKAIAEEAARNFAGIHLVVVNLIYILLFTSRGHIYIYTVLEADRYLCT